MKLNILNPKKALNKAFLKVKPNRNEIEVFKTQLAVLLDHTNDTESEEFHKNLVSDFLKNTYYAPNHFINTKGRNDLVIHDGETAHSPVGVIIETKKPTNKAEMLKQQHMNVKAFHELVLYYLRERITFKNLEIKHLIATNIYEWFIFDATVFEKLFAQNKRLVKQFTDFEAGRLAGTTTDFFYKEIAEPVIAEIMTEIACTYFDIREYEGVVRHERSQDDNQLIALFKLFSPEHLLKLPFANDSNRLDKAFYTELLHIIGLTETKIGSKKLIERKKEGQRNPGSLLENVIIQLDVLDKINRLERPGQFGETYQERLFNVGLDLVITWINRILFLKLLEAQLLTYHKGDASYAFLNLIQIKDFDDLNSLFFQVLARQPNERTADIKQVFTKIPYLNSSLFDPTELEHQTIFISNLKDDMTLPLHPSTVLKDKTGKRRTGELNTLEYFFTFLDAYDFASEGSEEIQEENKSLINASVLGLIFEKINGYKDGSFFTPGFITMYMCRETLRSAVVQKFNEEKNWRCKTLDDVYDKIEDRKEANDIFTHLKICDPAVGSGHFLVSALNEIIAIKSELRILQDRDGKRLKEYHVEVVNDELIVTDEDGELFEYNPTNKESQRLQVALFHEKQTIIEHCLFGVDINPNSVKICRLRLWIELLKNAYYNAEGELETLPNIDINIKCGNSLISRFALSVDLKQALKKNKWNITAYRNAVHTYREATSKEEKRSMEQLIHDIKGNFRTEIGKNDPKVKRLSRLQGELYTLLNQQVLFDESAKDQKAKQHKQEKLEADIQKLSDEIEEIEHNKMYENAFEWRFEFPEVLNDAGDFVGFDMMIGNPPYVQIKQIPWDEKKWYQKKFKSAVGRFNLFYFFIELSSVLAKPNGVSIFIVPDRLLLNTQCDKLRKWLLEEQSLVEIDSFDESVFDHAVVDSIIINYRNTERKGETVKAKTKILLNNLHIVEPKEIPVSYFLNSFNNQIDLDYDPFIANVLKKIQQEVILLGEIAEIKDGIIQSKIADELFLKKPLDNDSKKLLFGKDLTRYIITFNNNWVNYKPDDMMKIELQRVDRAPGLRLRKREIFERNKILTRQTADEIIGAYDVENYYYSNTLHGTTIVDKSYNPLYILAILNSKLITWYYRRTTAEGGKVFAQIKIEILRKLPVKKVDNSQQKPFIEIISQIIAIKQQNSAVDTNDLERRINLMVYKLYNLDYKDVKLIEPEIENIISEEEYDSKSLDDIAT